MTAPVAYTKQRSFTADSSAQLAGRDTVLAAGVDGELVNIQTAINSLITILTSVFRSDNVILDGSIPPSALNASVLALIGSAGFNVRGTWVTLTNYAIRDLVSNGTGTYVAIVAHVAGATFAADLAAGKWTVLFDTTNIAASAVVVTPTGNIASANAQAALAELDTKKLAVASNLSDVANANTARGNLSVPSKLEAQQMANNKAGAVGGTADAVTATFTPAIVSLATAFIVLVRALNPNATTAPTFNADGTGAQLITKLNGAALAPGDIAGAGHVLMLWNDPTSGTYLLLNPGIVAANPTVFVNNDTQMSQNTAFGLL